MDKRVVLVAGAGRRIGRATAAAFGKANALVVLTACTEADLQTTAELIRAAGSEATVVPCDVTAEPHVKRLVETSAAITGTIDVVVCSAGVAHVAPLAETKLADWERALRVLLTGTRDRAQMLQPADVANAIVHAADQPPHVAIDEMVLGHVGGPLKN